MPARALSYGIDRPMRQVYEFLAEPLNFASWAFAGDARMQPLSGGEWAVETSVGPRIVRFGGRNADGILTYFAVRAAQLLREQK